MVMPRPIAAGVLGIVRTIAARPRWRARPAKVLPAMIDANNVSEPAQRRYFGTTSSATCGLTANTTASGLGSVGSSSGEGDQRSSGAEPETSGMPAGPTTTQPKAAPAAIPPLLI